MSNPHETALGSPYSRPRWNGLAATMRGIVLVAALGGAAGFVVARLLWM